MNKIVASHALLTAALFVLLNACTPAEDGKNLKELNLDETELTLEIGETFNLTVTAVPADAEYTLAWTSSAPQTATVEDGLVTAIAEGTAIITAECDGIKDECTVTVTAAKADVTSISLDVNQLNIMAGQTYQLKATVLPEEASSYTIDWSSSDDGIATVSQEGLVTAIAAGNADITASCNGFEAICAVTVTEEPSVEEEPKTGDFYYSDGTWSTGLNTSKTVIGVVFWTGNPATDDAILAADHPQATRGLVVSLSELTGPWQSNYNAYKGFVNDWVTDNLTGYESLIGGVTGYEPQDRMDYMLGYNNTKAIKAFNEAPENSSWPVEAVAGLAAFEEATPAPEGTSGWYLPSIKEVSLIITGVYEGYIFDIMEIDPQTENKDFLNGVLAQIAGAEQIGSEILTSSSECDIYTPDCAYGIDGTCGQTAWPFKDETSTYRYILAF